MLATTRQAGVLQCGTPLVPVRRSRGSPVATGATFRPALAPSYLSRRGLPQQKHQRQRHKPQLCTAAASSPSSSGTGGGKDQPLAGDSPPAEIERQEERVGQRTRSDSISSVFPPCGCAAVAIALLMPVLLGGRHPRLLLPSAAARPAPGPPPSPSVL